MDPSPPIGPNSPPAEPTPPTSATPAPPYEVDEAGRTALVRHLGFAGERYELTANSILAELPQVVDGLAEEDAARLVAACSAMVDRFEALSRDAYSWSGRLVDAESIVISPGGDE